LDGCREKTIDYLKYLDECKENGVDLDEENTLKNVLKRKLKECTLEISKLEGNDLEEKENIVLNESSLFESKVNLETFWIEFEKDKPEMDLVLSEIDGLFETEGRLCLTNPSYFRGLIEFKSDGRMTLRFNAMGFMYKGVGRMIQTDPKMYPDYPNDLSWKRLVEILKEIEGEMKETKKKYEIEDLNGNRVRQPKIDLPLLFGNALLVQERLNFEMKKLSVLTNGSLYVGSGVKSMFRGKEKNAFAVPRRTGIPIDKTDFDIWDLSRGMISFDTLSQIVESYKTFSNQTIFPGIKIVNFYNRFKTISDENWSAFDDSYCFCR